MNVIEIFDRVNVRCVEGAPSLHKPLLLLVALSNCFRHRERLISFETYDAEIVKIEDITRKIQTEYAFGRLINDEIWEVDRYDQISKNSSGDLNRSELLKKNIHGGLKLEIYEALVNNQELILTIVEKLLIQYLPFELHEFIRTNMFPQKVNSNFPSPVFSGDLDNEVITVVEKGKHTIGLNESIVVSEFSNEFVAYLNSLHNLGAGGANALAESQATNPYFSDLYQPFPLVGDIVKALRNGAPKVVVLTGHAGDGKSTVALDVFKQLNGLPQNQELASPLNAREEIVLDRLKVYIVKDMSELAASQRLEWLKEGFSQPGNWLIVSNTGPLLNSLADYVQDKNFGSIESKVLELLDIVYVEGDLESHKISGLPKELIILNMTRLDNVTLGAGLLAKMVNHNAWSKCDACSSKLSCPINRNRLAVKDAIVTVQQRVRWVYQRLTAYECRLTLRQMVAHLSLSITGGMDCRQAHKYADDESSSIEGLERVLFSEIFFGYQKADVWKQAETLRGISLVRRSVFGTPTDASFERGITSNPKSPALSLPFGLQVIHDSFVSKARDFSGVRWRYALRRMLFLFGRKSTETLVSVDTFIDNFLQSPRLRDFDDWRQSETFDLKAASKSKMARDCLNVLLEIFSGFSAGQFKPGNDRLYLTLRRSDASVVQVTQLVVAVFNFDSFQITFDRERQIPRLSYQQKGVHLSLTLPLLDYIYLRSIGSLGDRLAPIHLSKLECFRSELLAVSKSDQKNSGEVQLLRAGIDGTVALYRYILDETNNKLERQ